MFVFDNNWKEMYEKRQMHIPSFADDTKLYRRVDSIQDAILLPNDLDKLEAWSISLGLVFNQKKCKQQHITRKLNPVEFQYNINDKPLEVTNHEKDLGLHVSSDLTWKSIRSNSALRQTSYWGSYVDVRWTFKAQAPAEFST